MTHSWPFPPGLQETGKSGCAWPIFFFAVQIWTEQPCQITHHVKQQCVCVCACTCVCVTVPYCTYLIVFRKVKYTVRSERPLDCRKWLSVFCSEWEKSDIHLRLVKVLPFKKIPRSFIQKRLFFCISTDPRKAFTTGSGELVFALQGEARRMAGRCSKTQHNSHGKP